MLAQDLPTTTLTKAELSSNVPLKEIAKFGGEHTRLGERFIQQQLAQAEGDPWMWVVDLPDETSTSFVRVMHVPRLMKLGRIRLPRDSEVNELHPRLGGGGFLDGRERDLEANPALKRALATGEKQAAKFARQQEEVAAKAAGMGESRYEELDERITGLEDKLDTALNKILSAVSGVPSSQAESEEATPEPIPISQALKCKHCDFEAKSRGGLTTHTRSKHRSEDGNGS